MPSPPHPGVLPRLVAGLLAAAFSLAVPAPPAVAAGGESAGGGAQAAAASKKAPARPKAAKAASNPKAANGAKAASKPTSDKSGKPGVALKRRPGAARRGAGRGVEAHRIKEGTPQITPFPNDHAAVMKAFAQNRRQQLSDAERVARAPKHNDRWQTVLFEIRELDARTDPEACFWRVLSFLRLGEVARARAMRQTCELPPRDLAALEAEEGTAASLQPTALVTPPRPEAEEPDHPPRLPGAVENGEAYTGPTPTPYK